MCDACGRSCCPLAVFTGCGCDGCEEPACWPKDEAELAAEGPTRRRIEIVDAVTPDEREAA